MIKARSAIENSLSTSLNFMEMQDIIKAIIKDPEIDLGYDYVPPVDEEIFIINEEELRHLEKIKEEPESGSGSVQNSQESDDLGKILMLILDTFFCNFARFNGAKIQKFKR